MYRDDFLQKKLNERKTLGAFRRLTVSDGKIDFCSNDYLGIVKNKLISFPMEAASSHPVTGSTGSRLLSGNYRFFENTEKQIANFHKAETALIFNSGYDANLGVLSCIPQRVDTILYDQLCHASIRDGIRLSFAHAFSFLHNDPADLENKLKGLPDETAGNTFVVTETLFSVDGDICPLQKIISIVNKYHAHLIIDEAHATGIIGKQGEGLVQSLQLQEEIFCRIHTFGKALGCHGAVVLGSQQLKDYLINFARSFIYTTALPELSVEAISRSYAIFPYMHREREILYQLTGQFQAAQVRYEKLPSSSPIQAVIIPGNNNTKAVAQTLQQQGFDVRPILYPTVPKGRERLRIVLHAFNTEEEVQALVELLS